VLVSGTGSILQALMDACAESDFGAQIVAVGADRYDTGGVARAAAAGIPTFVRRIADCPDRFAWDRALTEDCASFKPDLVILAGFLKLVGADFLTEFGGRLINTHPALLPSFPGMHSVRDALAHGVKVTGCSVILVDSGVDSGPILAQAAVGVRDDDDEESLHERIKVAERALVVDTVRRMIRHGWSVRGRVARIALAAPAARPARTRAKAVIEVSKVAIRRALISVYDKRGLTELAGALHRAGVQIVSTGSTAAAISAAGLPVTAVEQLTGFPEALDGRVKTLHPAVHAGLLADVSSASHREQLARLGIEPFELLVSNLYPFEQTVASGASPEECVEQIDIGGPAMVRAAAKNHATVAAVTSPAAYPDVLTALADGGFTLQQRRRLAAQAYAHTAAYDAAVSSWFAATYAPDAVAAETGWPDVVGTVWRRQDVLRYGENPHQRAALYLRSGSAEPGIAAAEVLHGKAMSYNNYVDADAARRAAFSFTEPCVAIMKHANPCGIAIGEDLAEAHRKAHASDPVSAYGGVIAANGVVTATMASQIADVFTEVIIAPDFEPAALEILTAKKNQRLLRCPPLPAAAGSRGTDWRQVSGGTLMQTSDTGSQPGDSAADWKLVAGTAADAQLVADLEFAWRACRAVKSNAILLAAGRASVGIGMGQVNRVDSCRLAVARAGSRAAGAAAASDAYFPFADGLQVLTEAGVRAIAEPGASIHDDEVIAAAQDAGVTLYFTGVRHFYH